MIGMMIRLTQEELDLMKDISESMSYCNNPNYSCSEYHSECPCWQRYKSENSCDEHREQDAVWLINKIYTSIKGE